MERDVIVCSTSYLRKLRQRYTTQKALAKDRGVDFEFAFDEWLRVWVESGHILERGKEGHQYVMARLEDKGPYRVGNVKIITGSEKVSESQIGRPRSQTWRANNSMKHRGRIKSVEHRRKLSEANKGQVPWNSPLYAGS